MVCTCIQIALRCHDAASARSAFKSTTSCIPCHTRRRMNRLKLISFHRQNAILFSVSNSDFMCQCVLWGVCVFGRVQCLCELESLAFQQGSCNALYVINDTDSDTLWLMKILGCYNNLIESRSWPARAHLKFTRSSSGACATLRHMYIRDWFWLWLHISTVV